MDPSGSLSNVPLDYFILMALRHAMTYRPRRVWNEYPPYISIGEFMHIKSSDVSIDVFGRLPTVLCDHDVRALRRIGTQLECKQADLVFAVFGRAVRNIQVQTSRPLTISALAEATHRLRNVGEIAGYELTLPRHIWPTPLRHRRQLRSLGARESAETGTVAFFYFRHSEAATLKGRNPALCHFDRSTYGTHDLVAEVTESDDHLLIEYFFQPSILNDWTAARLLFQYADGLRQAEQPMFALNVFGKEVKGHIAEKRKPRY